MVRPTDPLRTFDWDEPIYVDDTLSLRRLGRVLEQYRVGVVLVAHRSGAASDAVGVVGERDLVAAIARDLDLDVATVADLVEREILTADADERVLDVARRLLDAGVRHVAVTRDDDIVAVLSTRDLLAVLVDDIERRTN
ncbi:MAG: CBS domain-containing protein [Ilumatobacteraceae bacterium]